ncbi:MAG: amidophosphoribosyltransferase [Bacteroidota bacterium]|nr:amidophosphoribosyltransferase [Candidatus Kapabacteria bacterium]MDW8218974.1 amidophosphoribosyltransferase [Bacteroidota bacterium]
MTSCQQCSVLRRTVVEKQSAYQQDHEVCNSIEDKPRANCGVVGVFNHPQAALMSYYALHALQHRGQEAAGIVASRIDADGRARFAAHKGEGLVLDVFSQPGILTEHLAGTASIGHNRYSTTGSSKAANIQPFWIKYRAGNIALAHNGNLTNTRTLREQLQNDGAIFQTTTDSELFLHLIARSKAKTQIAQIRDSLQTAKGAYSLVLLTEHALYAARDPHGFRPLCIGRKKVHINGNEEYAYFVVSETCALDIVSAEFVREVGHNEIIMIDRETIETGTIHSCVIDKITPQSHHCIFEYIYFSRPDSRIFGHNVDKVRRKLGKALAEEHPVMPDNDDEPVRAIAVPDSANTATIGFAQNATKLGIPTRYEIGLIRSHYVGRTFIAPGQDQREFKVKAKFNIVRGVLHNRKVVVVDDSIVRGTTSRSIVRLIREAQPREVHLRISSPPITHPCKYGMDFPDREELVANQYNNEEEIARAVEADSVRYLSVEKLLSAVPQDAGYCTACFTGKYPVPIDTSGNKFSIEEV